MSYEIDYEPDYLVSRKFAYGQARRYGFFGYVIGLINGAALSLIYFLVT